MPGAIARRSSCASSGFALQAELEEVMRIIAAGKVTDLGALAQTVGVTILGPLALLAAAGIGGRTADARFAPHGADVMSTGIAGTRAFALSQLLGPICG